MKAIAVFVLVAFLCVPAFANDPDDDECTVTLTIVEYIEVGIAANLGVTVTPPATTGTANAAFTYSSNVAVDISGAIVQNGGHGDWAWTCSYGGNTDTEAAGATLLWDGAPVTNGGGGNIAVTVSDVQLEDNMQANPGGATVTLTIAAD